MSVSDVFRRITQALDDAGIAYMLSGSFASAYYGVPRSTQDIDLVIEATPDQLRALVQRLPGDEYYVDLNAALEAQQRESQFNLIDLATGWKIDLILRKNRPFSREEFGRRRRVTLQGLSIFVASPEDIVIAKMEWSRAAQSLRQVQDAAAIVRLRGESLDRAYLEQWIRELSLEREWNTTRSLAGI